MSGEHGPKRDMSWRQIRAAEQLGLVQPYRGGASGHAYIAARIEAVDAARSGDAFDIDCYIAFMGLHGFGAAKTPPNLVLIQGGLTEAGELRSRRTKPHSVA